MNLTLYTVLLLACITSIKSQGMLEALKEHLGQLMAGDGDDNNAKGQNLNSVKDENDQPLTPENLNFFVNAGLNTFLWIKKINSTKRSNTDNAPREAYLVIIGELSSDVKAGDFSSAETDLSKEDNIKRWLKKVLETVHAGAADGNLENIVSDRTWDANPSGYYKSLVDGTFNADDQTRPYFKDVTRGKLNREKPPKKRRIPRPKKDKFVKVKNIMLNNKMNKVLLKHTDITEIKKLVKILQVKFGMAPGKVFNSTELQLIDAVVKNSDAGLEVAHKVFGSNSTFQELYKVLMAYKKKTMPVERTHLPLQEPAHDDEEYGVIYL